MTGDPLWVPLFLVAVASSISIIMKSDGLLGYKYPALGLLPPARYNHGVFASQAPKDSLAQLPSSW